MLLWLKDLFSSLSGLTFIEFLLFTHLIVDIYILTRPKRKRGD